MGRLLQFIDLKRGRMARKVADKRHVGDLDAPRNSLELPEETSQSYFSVGENVPRNYQITKDWSEKNCYRSKATTKKLINEEISKIPKTRHNAPSIVARLMGVDMLPVDTKSVAQQVEKKNEKPGASFPKEKQTKNGSVDHVPFPSKCSRQTDSDFFHHSEDRDPDQWSGSMKLKKTRPREHPQEEELQKFKKEFEAWQAERLNEYSKIVELGTIPNQWMAKENLSKEEMILYENSGRMTSEKPKKLENFIVKESPHKNGGLPHHGYKNELFPHGKKDSVSLRSRMPNSDFERSALETHDQNLAISSTPTRIVILRPCPDSIGNNEESWASSPVTSEERGNMEDFLEEVKARLKCELQGKTSKGGSMVRGGGIETLYSEKPSDPKQIAQRMANQARESVTRDLGINLLRSESTRSYRSEIQDNGTSSPEFISRDTKRVVSERLRSVMKRETHPDFPMVVHSRSRSAMLDNEKGRFEQSRDILNDGNKLNYWDSVKDEHDMQSRSFRCRPDDDLMLHKELSPRNLIRSLSAPLSGTSFGKLLLEDRHTLTGTHIRRKHEAIERVTVKVKKQKKEKFNFKEKVSSFKYRFTFRGRLFGRKFQSSEESLSKECEVVKDIMSGPTVMMNFGDRYENSTEVPPSPASTCSSVHEEFWRPTNHLSPTTASDVPPLENAIPQVFREINSNLNELRRQLNQLETHGSEETMFKDEPLEAEIVEFEDRVEAYIRDLFVASGLYDGSYDKSLSRWDPFAKPISNRVFEEIEKSYRKKTNYNEGSPDQGEKKVDHKLLRDLLNEALFTVLGPPVTMSKFGKNAIDIMLRPPRGRKLLDSAWEIMCVYLYPPADKSFYSIDRIVARDFQSCPWSGLMYDDIDAFGKEMECQIIGDLIEEVVKDVYGHRESLSL